MGTSMLATVGVAAKFRGCLIGSLIGDCLGAPFEGDFPVSKTVLGNYFTKILSGETKQIFSYTDDTAMSLSVTKSLIENKKICSNDLAKRFVNVYFNQPNRGYGMNVIQVFEVLKESQFQDVFLPAKMQFNGSGSYGNGAAMRIAPVALFAHDKDEDFIKHAVEQCSLVTHTHPNGYNGAILQCLAVHSALKLDSSKELDPVKFISELEEKMEKIETKRRTPYCDKLKKIREIYLKKQEDIKPDEVAKYLGNDVSALESVPTAIYSFLRSLKPLADYESPNPFIRAIYFAISVGGDTDTIATMAGAIAGAYHGEDLIPTIVKSRCENIEVLEKLADDLLNAVQT